MRCRKKMFQLCFVLMLSMMCTAPSWGGGGVAENTEILDELIRLKRQNRALMERLEELEKKFAVLSEKKEAKEPKEVKKTKGIEVKAHGSMVTVVGTSNNVMNFSPHQKSGSTDFFAYNGHASKIKRYDSELSSHFGLAKGRLRFEVGTTDGLAKFVYGLEFGAVNWGNKDKGFGLSGDGINQETRFGYIQFALPKVGGNYVRIGLQPTKINQWVWTETAPGITYHGRFGTLKYLLGWYRGEDDKKEFIRFDNERQNDYYVGKVEGNVAHGLKLGAFVIYADQGAEKAVGGDIYNGHYYYTGLTGKGKSGDIFGNFDLIYQGGEIDFEAGNIDDLDRSAYLLNGTIGYKVSDQTKVYFNALYVSGDDDPSDKDVDNFDSIDVDVKVGIIFFKDSYLADADRFYSDAPYISDKGLINLALCGEHNFDSFNHVKVALRWLQTAEDLVYDNMKEDDLGTEIDLWYTYKYNKNLALRVEAAYLFAGDATQKILSDDGDDFYYIGTGMKFKF